MRTLTSMAVILACTLPGYALAAPVNSAVQGPQIDLPSMAPAASKNLVNNVQFSDDQSPDQQTMSDYRASSKHKKL